MNVNFSLAVHLTGLISHFPLSPHRLHSKRCITHDTVMSESVKSKKRGAQYGRWETVGTHFWEQEFQLERIRAYIEVSLQNLIV